MIDFPIFNVADCYVVVSSVVLALLIGFFYQESELEVYYKKTADRSSETDKNSKI